ncbi:hypothetical protein SYNPS1DRAFT_24346 [Syncephalis pseudoplumigaleata]|uniref:DNA-directed RNA polymerase subunit n=1 Tax=Syncephalis pseudoplumigaleata TaxID=1712513 RepID=A0A4P9YUW2_9FUNG|nr:hypothetical protein SYNPS1DRAFT_24346 [Syncephalis pseudoplumigaleata]|eukprot:RKP23585.1 hypothetical protein SYNPS1DRAFT_24346 [Syncephalis pseudoplumigaleata]
METHGFQTRNQYGSLFFCPSCGNLLDALSEQKVIVCNQCGDSQSAQLFESFEVVTKSAENAFNSPLKLKRMLVQQTKKRETAATIKEKCPKCGAPEMSFHTMQLRSADEGQTIFYNCVKCGYKFSVNS